MAKRGNDLIGCRDGSQSTTRRRDLIEDILRHLRIARRHSIDVDQKRETVEQRVRRSLVLGKSLVECDHAEGRWRCERKAIARNDDVGLIHGMTNVGDGRALQPLRTRDDDHTVVSIRQQSTLGDRLSRLQRCCKIETA